MVPSMPARTSRSLAVASSPVLLQEAMSPCADEDRVALQTRGAVARRHQRRYRQCQCQRQRQRCC
jgi:hypothetical protein